MDVSVDHVTGPRVRAIVVSASADNWQRIPPPKHDWGTFTLADMDRVWQNRQRSAGCPRRRRQSRTA